MAVKVISDLHSAAGSMKVAIHKSDTLLLLGDLVNIIDYTTMDGVLVEIFGVDAVRQVIELRAQRRFDEAREVMARRREGLEDEIARKFQTLVRAEYEKVFAAIPDETYLILGNVDSPAIVEKLAPSGVIFADGKVIELLGLKIGFVGGGLPTPLKIQGEIPEEEYDAKLWSLGEVDVVCSHMPPDARELTYDVVAQRHERGSPALLRYIQEVQPRAVFFGHIHQPMVSSMHIGRTHLVNCGYFRRTRQALDLSWMIR